jgi:Protein of unknown function (DUF2584)
MGMPCQINSILKLSEADYPTEFRVGGRNQVTKSGYRIFPMDVPLQLVNQDWVAHADAIVRTLVWSDQTTVVTYEISRVYDPFSLK